MPNARVIFYKELSGKCPVLEWLENIPKRSRAKAELKIARLSELGHELRRPESDYLRDGIHELRWKSQSVNYRILYFFYGRKVVVLANGLTKEARIPSREIETAIERSNAFRRNPYTHT